MTSRAPLNQLAGETSPYLLQHASNPVAWRPWGREALGEARRLDRPIFLSIGYAACHWCHVMAHESFEDEATAALLNERFVPIKVDREERPDIDAVYMAAVQALTGSGGWPLNVFLTPQLHPFHGGTYFPPERRWGRPSFIEVLQAVVDAWEHRRAEIERGGGELVAHLASSPPPAGAEIDVASASRLAMEAMSRSFDVRWGGFGPAPKFPTPSRLQFLLERATTGDAKGGEMLATTLDGMGAGGMWDWVGGGFHRYSVDRAWLVPHFEKMLYDNALLARIYAEAGVRLGEPRWTAVGRRAADYVLRELRGAEGGFYSSSDADSEGEEGRFFTWTTEEIRAALPPADAAAVIEACGLEGEPNCEGGRWVLRPSPPAADPAAAAAGGALRAAGLERARLALYEARSRRVPPATDDKRLAAWNGMAAWALAWLGAALGEPRYLDAARGAARHLLGAMRTADGRLARSWRDGRVSGAETLEDVAWVTAGLVELYQADGEPAWLEAAEGLVEARLPHYLDERGALLDAPSDGEALPFRPHDAGDGAVPASAAVMAAALLRLAALRGRHELAETARRAIAAEAGLLARAPHACSGLLAVAAAAERPPLELVVVGAAASARAKALLRAGRTARRPPDVVAWSPTVPVPAHLARLVPLFAGRESPTGGEAVAYLCEGGSCRLPTADPEELAGALEARE